MTRDDGFEVLPAGQMRAKYRLTAANRPTIKLEAVKLPPVLRHLIPLAERFGIEDDLIRADVVAKTPPADLAALRLAVAAADDALDEWLAGPAATAGSFSPEYAAFTCMRMAADGC